MAMPTPRRAVSPPEAWCELIHRRCGLQIRSAQVPAVMEGVHAHADAAGMAEADYFDRLAAAPEGDAEWLSLIEQMVNHETSFFRHPPSFAVLRNRLLPELRT